MSGRILGVFERAVSADDVEAFMVGQGFSFRPSAALAACDSGMTYLCSRAALRGIGGSFFEVTLTRECLINVFL